MLQDVLDLLHEQGVGSSNGVSTGRQVKLPILTLRQLSLRLFAKILLIANQDGACAEVNSLALAVAAGMKSQANGKEDDAEFNIEGDPRKETYKETPHKLARRRASQFDSDSSDDDDESAYVRNNKTPPISNRHMQMYRMRQRRSLMYP